MEWRAKGDEDRIRHDDERWIRYVEEVAALCLQRAESGSSRTREIFKRCCERWEANEVPYG